MRLANLAYHEYHLLFINNNGSGRSESWKRRKAIKTSKVLMFVTVSPKHIIQHSLFPKDTSYHGTTILNTDFKHCSRVCHKIFRFLAKPCTVISLLYCKCDILLVSKLVSLAYLYSWWRWACLLIGKPNFQISCEKFSLYSHFCLCSPLFPLANEATLR